MSLDATLRDLVRDVVRQEIGPTLREELRNVLRERTAEPVAPSPNPEERLLSVAEAATLVGVTEQTVRAWVQSGSLPASRLGHAGKVARLIRIRKLDLDAFLARRLESPAADPDAQIDRILGAVRDAHEDPIRRAANRR